MKEKSLNLLSPIELGPFKLKNRVVMAALTRCRVENDGVPNKLLADYYSSRTDFGLIIAEANAVSLNGHGSPHAVCLFNDA